MKTIQASDWGNSLAWYYKTEGDKSAEQFCDDMIIPELTGHKEPFAIDFTSFKIGVSTQMVWIMGYYLFNNGFSVDEIKERVTFIDHDFKDTQEEFIESVVDAERQLAKETLTLK